MADAAVEFYNQVNRTMSQMTTGLTLVSNGAGESAVVRDLYIDNPKRRKLVLTNGSFPVLRVSESAKFSGHEIVGASRSLVLKSEDIATFNRVHKLTASALTTAIVDTLFQSDFDADFSVNEQRETVTAISPALTVNPVLHAYYTSGDLYYTAHGQTAVYRRVGGVNGAQTSISLGSSVHAFAHDGGRYIYILTANKQLHRLDMQTAAITTKSFLASNFNTSLGSIICALPDYLYLVDELGYNACMANWTAGTAGPLIQHSGVPYAQAALLKNSEDEFIAVRSLDSNTLLFMNYGSRPVDTDYESFSKTYALGASSTVVPSTTSHNFMHRLERLQRYALLCRTQSSDQQGLLIDADGLSARPVLLNFPLPTTSTPYDIGYDSTQGASDYGLIGVYAAGIKTT